MSKQLRQIVVQVNPASSSATSLADAAASLTAGGYVVFPIATWGSSGTGWTGAFLDWLTRWHWDPINLKGYMMCKSAGTTGQPYKLIVYDAATNAFSKPYDQIVALGGGSSVSGHGYDSAAMNPATGDFYFLQLSHIYVVKWNGSGWDYATGNITGTTGGASVGPPGLSWHPNLYGTGDGGLLNTYSNRVRAWRASTGASGTWTAIFNTPYSSGSYSEGVYCSALNIQIVSFGDKGLAGCRVDPGTPPVGSLMPYNFPVYCSSQESGGDKMSRLMPTPSGSVCILESAVASRVWRLNTSTLAWDLQPFTHPLKGINNSWPTMYVSTYGVYWSLREENGGNSAPSSILWKPPAGL